jgi:hypothetical protein
MISIRICNTVGLSLQEHRGGSVVPFPGAGAIEAAFAEEREESPSGRCRTHTYQQSYPQHSVLSRFPFVVFVFRRALLRFAFVRGFARDCSGRTCRRANSAAGSVRSSRIFHVPVISISSFEGRVLETSANGMGHERGEIQSNFQTHGPL